MGMYQIAKREEQEWRKKQAKEIREMLFRNQQPDSMRAAIKEIKLNLVFKVPDSDDDLEGLKSAVERLDATIEQMGKNPSLGRFGSLGKEPTGLVPTTHEAIHNHSRRQLHPRWLWITKNSVVDWDGRLGFPATREEL
jgi:hypothetical protein